jgi:hypothetical protein
MLHVTFCGSADQVGDRSGMESSSKTSFFAQLRANLEKISENSTISSSIDDFYRQQKADKKGEGDQSQSSCFAAPLSRTFRQSNWSSCDETIICDSEMLSLH